LEIRKKYSPIYRDARLLLRPKTGLKDMIVEMDPGNRSAGALPSGATLPVDNSAPDVNPDEILASVDADTRAYLTILLNAGARASQDANIRASLRLLPGTLTTAQSTLGKAEVLANHLGPTLQDLRPTARALGPALAATRPFLHDTTPIIQNQLRPFARVARQPVRDLRRAA